MNEVILIKGKPQLVTRGDHGQFQKKPVEVPETYEKEFGCALWLIVILITLLGFTLSSLWRVSL